MNKIIIIFLLISVQNICAQKLYDGNWRCLNTEVVDELGAIDSREANNISIKKVVRVAIHFIQDANGGNNFTETDDGSGNTNLSGYEMARIIEDWVNSRWNEPLNIPPNNSIPNLDRNIDFMIEGVYFHKDGTYNDFDNLGASTVFTTYGVNTDEVIQVFICADNGPNGGTGGFATSLSATSKYKAVFSGYYEKYKNEFANNQNPIEWWIHSIGNHFGHEILHLLGLSHTVRWNWGPPCPNNNTTNCGDGFADTPSVYEMYNSYNSNNHPACGWGNGSVAGCSNNWMDYSGSGALSPNQINKIHVQLEGGMSTYTLCEELLENKLVCELGYPIRKLVGNEIEIGNSTCTSSSVIESGETYEVIFNDNVEIHELVIEGDSDFEITWSANCQF